MLKRDGKNIYKDKLSKILYQANYFFKKGQFEFSDKYLVIACDIIDKENDINGFSSNIHVLNNKIIACSTALKENILFENDRDKYLQEFLSNKFQNITQVSPFEKALKEVIRYLGMEKRGSKIVTSFMEMFYDLRQRKIKEINKEFSSKRKAFLSKYIQ